MSFVAPALLAADFTRLGEALAVIKDAGARMVHIDVADGHFVPELTLGQPVIASLRRATDLVLDVHLLIERPERYIPDFVRAGADRLSVQAEATPQLHRALVLIREHGAKAGVVLNPGTSVDSVAELLPDVDFLGILCVDPAGNGGLRTPAFITRSKAKVRAAAESRLHRRLEFAIQAEGGIGFENLEELVLAGADILITDSTIFDKNSLDESSPESRLRRMMRLASQAGQTSNV